MGSVLGGRGRSPLRPEPDLVELDEDNDRTPGLLHAQPAEHVHTG